MPGYIGRKVTFEIGDSSPMTQIDGIREKSASHAGSPVDVTSDESDGWRSLLTEAGQNEVNISISGVVKNNTLRDMWYSADRTKTVRLTYLDGGTIEGTFYLASYNEGMPYNDASTFDAELQSSGEVIYTPPSP